MRPWDEQFITNLSPPLVLRSRREENAVDSINKRFVEMWTTDAPVGFRLTQGYNFMDMNATPSRLYDEDLRQSQPFIPGGYTSTLMQADSTILVALSTVQSTQATLYKFEAQKGKAKEISTLKTQLEAQQKTYTNLLQTRIDIETDSITTNPFFDKYDVAGDPRNIVRELRSGVYETGTTRGYNESQRLLTRTLDDRWLPRGYASTTGIDTYLYYTKGRR